MEKLLFTSESVTEGHPDKMCDAISDAILDACMEQDPMSRVACEAASCTGFVLVTGEITTKATLDIPAIVRKTVNEIGYNDAKTGFDGHTCAVMVALDQQSADIAMGVDKALEAKEGELTDDLDTGAGDQGMMFGYATNETPEFMPYPISLAHKLALQLTKVRKDGTLTYLRPDGKTQVSVEYDEAGKPKRLEAVVLSTQHDEDVTQEQIHEDIKKYVFDPILPKELIDGDTKFFINPTGLTEDYIDNFAMIVAIADVYDAMTAARSYRSPLCPFEVISKFEEDGFQKYHTKYILVFLKQIASTYQSNRVILSDGRGCTIVMLNQNALSRPIVQFDDKSCLDLSTASRDLYIKAVL